MPLFGRRLPPTPEEQHAARVAPARARAALDAYAAHDQEARRAQMDVDVYGRPGRPYSDPERAVLAAEARDRHAARAAEHLAEHRRQAALAPAEPAPKSGRLTRRFLGGGS
ncbi:hypothetical protein [Kitasatospora sp. NPDC006786]|uniref:hypothetical protein n=1 Tax=unclassified Kitasatospora TaxID=2633591 RepID=UPI0033F688C1